MPYIIVEYIPLSKKPLDDNMLPSVPPVNSDRFHEPCVEKYSYR